MDIFSKNKKDYLQSIKNEEENFVKTVEKNIKTGIEILEKNGRPPSEKEIKIIRDHITLVEKLNLDEKLDIIKKARKAHVNKWFKISTGIGISLGTIVLAIKNIYQKQKKELTTNQNIQSIDTNNQSNAISINSCFFFGNNKKQQIAFKGIIDKIAENLNQEQLKELNDYVNGLNPTVEEIESARRIADFRLKDWPKGIRNTFVAKYFQPATDIEYHTQLLKQEIMIPPEPPKYYRNYDKWFNTKTWRDYLTWPDYIRKSAQFERMESIINIERVNSYANEKALLEQATRKELSHACLRYQINEDFLLAFNSDNKKVKIPDAVMIQSENKDNSLETLKWIVGKSNSNYVFMNDKDEPNYTRLEQILTVLEEAEVNYKKNGKHTLLWIENFEKLLSNDPDNENVIGDLKDMLDKISKKYKTTIIFSCNNTNGLNPIVLQPHRVKIYNMDKDAPLEELQKIQNNYILSNIQKIQNSDGYRYKFVPFENDFVDLYLGDFSHNSKVLWVNSQNTEAIKAVIKNFHVVKMIPQFKHIKSIKFPKPNNIKEFDAKHLNCTGNITIDGKVIYEYFM